MPGVHITVNRTCAKSRAGRWPPRSIRWN